MPDLLGPQGLWGVGEWGRGGGVGEWGGRWERKLKGGGERKLRGGNPVGHCQFPVPTHTHTLPPPNKIENRFGRRSKWEATNPSNPTYPHNPTNQSGGNMVDHV
jgi:hypothetical protein